VSGFEKLTTPKRSLLIALTVLSALFVSAACVGSDSAPAADSNFTPAKADATTAPAATKAPTATVAPTSSTAPAAAKAPAVTTAPIAATAPTATVAPAPTIAATQAPQPTATTAPSPTAAPSVDNGPWITALEAIKIASASQSGVISYIDGHAASSAGEKDTSDNPSDITSPGAGYGTYWTVAFLLESGSTNFCSVLGQELDCWESAYTPAPGDISGVTIDSTEAFAAYEKTEDWNTIMANENVSLLLVLEPGSGELDPTHTYWSAIASVQGTDSGIGGGSFYWDLDTDTVTHTTWSY
jgi:hypothetical protein